MAVWLGSLGSRGCQGRKPSPMPFPQATSSPGHLVQGCSSLAVLPKLQLPKCPTHKVGR